MQWKLLEKTEKKSYYCVYINLPQINVKQTGRDGIECHKDTLIRRLSEHISTCLFDGIFKRKKRMQEYKKINWSTRKASPNLPSQ